MSDPITRKPPAFHRAPHTSTRLLIAAALLPALHVSADCPEPVEPQDTETPTITAIDPNADINVLSDSAEATREGQMFLKGEVTITQGARTIKTRDATLDQNTNEFSVSNGVELSDPTLKIR